MSKQKKSTGVSGLRKLFSKISSFFAMVIDKLLYSSRYSALVSLGIALLLFFSVSYSNQQANSISSSYTFEKVPVEVLVDQQQFDVMGIPEHVTAIVTGDFVAVNTIKNEGNVSVVVDLENLGEGNHHVKLGTKGVSPSLDVMTSPDAVDVSIRRKSSRTFEVQPEFINLDKVDPQYLVSEPKLDKYEVTINASNEKLDSIAMVKALIDVKEKQESFDTQAIVMIYDQEGKSMDVVVSPKTINANVTISSPSRQVPVVVEPVGELPNNKAIESIAMDFEAITLFGSQDVLNKISSIKAPINAEGLIQDTKLKVTLVTPDGINHMNTQTVSLDIVLGTKTTKTVEKSQIFFENNNKNYEIKKVDGSQMVADVLMEGSQKQLDSIDVSKLRVSLDMSKIGIGQHKVKLVVTGPNPLVKYKVVNEEIEIIVSQKEN